MERFIPAIIRTPVDHDPFAGPAIEQTIPTTEAQREVFVASEMGVEASCAYNESVTLELSGTLDRTAIATAVQQLVDRHVALRSTISPSGTRMVVEQQLTIDLPFTDLSSLSVTERPAAWEALTRQDMTTPYDLRNGPLFRTRLVKMDADTHMLRLAGHHIVCDGWSLGIMMAEVSALYNAARTGNAASLPPAVPYGDYSLATIDIAKSPEQARIEQYWTSQFKGPLQRMDLPTDRPRPKQKTFRGERIDLEMPPELVRGLKEVATRTGASFVTTLLTTFELLLHKLTGNTDLVVGLPAAGQSDLDMKHLVGHCVNLLALRSRIDDERPFAEHLKERRTAVLDAFDNQKYTFGTLLRTLNIPREPGRIPLVPVVFNIDMNMDDGVAFDGLHHRFHSDPRAFENFELFLNATGSEQGLVLEWSFNTDLFDAGTVRGWMDQLLLLVQRIIAAPQASLAELVGDEPIDQEVVMPSTQWEGRSTMYPRSDVGSVFREVAMANAASTALILGDQQLDYRSLAERVDAAAMALVARGVQPGRPIGICMERSFDMVVGMLAILRSGACFVPFDPAYPAERIAFMLEDTGVDLVLVQDHLRDSLPPTAHTTTLAELAPATAPLPTIAPETPAYIMYTSGSTGTPKGVVVPHRAILRLVREQNFLPFGPELTFLQLSNTSFDASTLEIWGALLNGGRLVLQPQTKPTLLEITESIRTHKVTTVWFTVGLFNLLVDEHLDKLRGLKHILTGGDVLSVPHVKKALAALGPGVLINGYGPTENTTFTCCYPINDAASIKTSVPIGFPLNNTSVHVLDEQLQPVGVGRKGELYTGGDGVALGYWKRPELNAERFIDDPFISTPGAKLYRTGDLVRWQPDGSIEFIGRADGQVKVRGFRVELGEIENAIAEVPGVKDRVVVLRQDTPGEKQLVAYLVALSAPAPEDQSALIASVRLQLREQLPEYMVPTAFVVLPELPLTPNGKVDRRALPAPEFRQQLMRAEHVAPRDPVERELAAIWRTALKVDSIGIHDNFFDLGGHSLIGIQVLGQVEQHFGRSLPLSALFEAPTIAEFARGLQVDGAGSRWKNLSSIQPIGDRAPLFCVHGDEANHFIPRYLGSAHPFFAFFHQGEDGRAIEHQSVEAIAAHFIRELKQARPEGPYLLCGYSFGGIVAYEMAQQLRKAGDDVPMLVVFDTYAPHLHAAAVASDRKFYEPVKNAVYRGLIARDLARGKVLSPRLRHFHIIDTYDRAVMAYRPAPMEGPLTVFKARESWGAEDMGWKELAPDVDVHVLPGDHYSMIKEPHVKELVKVLAGCMDKALLRHAVEAV